MDAVFDLFGFSQCHGDTEHRSKLVLLFQLSLICCLFFEGFKSRMSPLFSRFSHPSKLLPTSCSYISVSPCLCERSTLRSSDEMNSTRDGRRIRSFRSLTEARRHGASVKAGTFISVILDLLPFFEGFKSRMSPLFSPDLMLIHLRVSVPL